MNFLRELLRPLVTQALTDERWLEDENARLRELLVETRRWRYAYDDFILEGRDIGGYAQVVGAVKAFYAEKEITLDSYCWSAPLEDVRPDHDA